MSRPNLDKLVELSVAHWRAQAEANDQHKVVEAELDTLDSFKKLTELSKIADAIRAELDGITRDTLTPRDLADASIHRELIDRCRAAFADETVSDGLAEMIENSLRTAERMVEFLETHADEVMGQVEQYEKEQARQATADQLVVAAASN